MAAGRDKKKCLTASWQRCYYPPRSRDALSPICGVFLYYFNFWEISVLTVLTAGAAWAGRIDYLFYRTRAGAGRRARTSMYGTVEGNSCRIGTVCDAGTTFF